MAEVFISYSKQDFTVAQALAKDLEAYGAEVWWDTALYAGRNFHDDIVRELDAAKAVIVIWSAPAATSEWVRAEATRASRQKKLISTTLPEFDLNALPLPFDQLHCELVTDRPRILRAVAQHGVRVDLNRVPAEELGRPTAQPVDDIQWQMSRDAAVNKWKVDDYAGAIIDCTKAIKANPNKAHGYTMRAYSYEKSGSFTEAERDYAQAVALEPSLVSGRARFYQRCGAAEKALVDYAEALRIAPKDPTIYMDRAELLEKRGDSAGAFRDLNMGISFADGFHRSLMLAHRANLYLAIGNKRAAIDDLTAAIPLAEADHLLRDNVDYSWGNLADIYASVGDYRPAVAAMERKRAANSGRFYFTDEKKLEEWKKKIGR